MEQGYNYRLYKKRFFVGTIFVIFFIVMIIYFSCFFTPRPIVKNLETAYVIQVIYISSDLGDKVLEINNYDAESLLQYLSNCFERKTIYRAQKGYSLDDFDLIITLNDGNTIKQILLGKKSSYTNCGYGSSKYEVLEPSQTLIEIKKILDVSVEEDI